MPRFYEAQSSDAPSTAHTRKPRHAPRAAAIFMFSRCRHYARFGAAARYALIDARYALRRFTFDGFR